MLEEALVIRGVEAAFLEIILDLDLHPARPVEGDLALLLDQILDLDLALQDGGQGLVLHGGDVLGDIAPDLLLGVFPEEGHPRGGQVPLEPDLPLPGDRGGDLHPRNLHGDAGSDLHGDLGRRAGRGAPVVLVDLLPRDLIVPPVVRGKLPLGLDHGGEAEFRRGEGGCEGHASGRSDGDEGSGWRGGGRDDGGFGLDHG